LLLKWYLQPIVSDQQPPIDIKEPVILYYLKELADLGVYGGTAGRVASLILRKEIMHLIATGVLDKVPGKMITPAPAESSARPKRKAKGPIAEDEADS
jgi:hypothetical protein